MRFGLVYDFRNPAHWRRPYVDLYRDLIEQIQFADELGFDSVYVTEHHFVEDGYCPAPLVAATAIAAKTRRIRVGTWILLLPLRHPVEVAEEVAILDQISDGRVELGVGLGYRDEEFQGYGVDVRKRGRIMEEKTEVMLRALQGETVSYTGEFVNVESARVSPSPVQQPFNIWMGARGNKAADRAGRFGAKLMQFGPKSVYDTYLATLEGSSDITNPGEVSVMSPWFASHDPEKSWQEIRPHVSYMSKLYGEWYGGKDELPQDEVFRAWQDWNDEEFRRTIHVGTPDAIANSIEKQAAKQPVTEVLSWGNLPGLDPAVGRASLECFAKEVMPRFK